MIRPEDVAKEANKKSRKNLQFRTYLKNHADEDVLDEQFKRLHQELFADYDCSKCRNCCKMYKGNIPESDLEEDAKYLNMTKEAFIEKYLEKGRYNYNTKHQPCDFLKEDGSCLLNDHKPDSCKKYPYTDQPGRLFSLYSMLNAVEVCPVAYEIYERLKTEYNFR